MTGRPPSIGKDGGRRKTRMTDLAITIRDMADAGMTAREIAKAMGRNKSSVARVARWHGVRLQTSQTRAYRVALSRDHAEVIIRLAGESSLPEAEIITRIVHIVTGEGLERARKKLGKRLGKETTT